MIYWLIVIALVIIIASLIYYNNNVIEGLGESNMTKYYEDTSRIDNMLRMITMKITELRMTLPENYVSMLTPNNINNLKSQRETNINKINILETKMKNAQTDSEKQVEQNNIYNLNQQNDELTDAITIIRLQSQHDFVNNAKQIIESKYNIKYYESKIELIQKEMDNLPEQDKSKKQNELDNYTRNIQIEEVKITRLEGENKVKLDSDASLPEASKIYTPLQNMIEGKSSSNGSSSSTSYEIPVDENGKIDPTKFYDYIDDDAIKAEADENKGTWVKSKDGSMVKLEDIVGANFASNNINYYEPGTYKYGPNLYIPSYEDSIYLSKTTGKHTASEYLDMASLAGGICTHYKDYPDKLEEECNKLDKNICGSTDCCVLLGGSKCVSGNAQGPTSKLNYNDITIRNRDYYYYKGKCYGNCQNQFISSNNQASEDDDDVITPVPIEVTSDPIEVTSVPIDVTQQSTNPINKNNT